MIHGLPEKLQKLRGKYGLSQKQVAGSLGISPSIVSGYETGERTPSTEILLALSYLYKCSTDYLLGKDDNAPGFLIDTSGLNDEQIQVLVNLVEVMKRK